MVWGEIRLTRKPVVVSPDLEIIDQWALEILPPNPALPPVHSVVVEGHDQAAVDRRD